MTASFDLFRLSLLPRNQRDLFKAEMSREEFLRDAFGQERAFEHYNTQFHYRIDFNRSSEEAIIARLGRAVVIDENLSPEEGLEEVSHPGWKACVVVIDPREHEDGQKVSVQVDRLVGTPLALLNRLVREINDSQPTAQYVIEAQPIFDADSFWEFADENEGAITTLTFEFIVPNGLWSADSSLKDELRAAKELLGAQQVINTFKSNDGLETNGEQIKEAVDYAEKGSGRVKARARGGKKFDSTERPKTAKLEDNEEENEPVIVRAARHLAKILGRE